MKAAKRSPFFDEMGIATTNDAPIVIAGPCSVESREQLLTVVGQLHAERRISAVRCGVWKPRSRPGGFEGLGEEALGWIKEVKAQYPEVRFCCEVARPEHVESCLRSGAIDMVWIGARTTVNPFLVGELVAALRGSRMTVLVKNPITPDIALWVGAIERLRNAGLDDLVAVHRGFTTYNNMGYRNNPLWEIPIELKRRMPDLPLLCDPSHIGGRRDLVAPLAQQALDLHYDGLMIECHPDPDNALTDKAQQLTPEALLCLLDGLQVRAHGTQGTDEMQRLRDQLDVIDGQVLELLALRMRIASQIGHIKHELNMPVFQPQRWQQVLSHQLDVGCKMGLSEQFVRELMEKIHVESLRHQNE